MKKSLKSALVILFALTLLVCFSITAYAAGYYVHDPMKNPKAAVDIIVDPNAVYGYAPNPDSPRLGVFAQYDWSDEAFVEEMKQEREAYHESMKELYQIKSDMEAEGKSVEEIARAVSTRRNEIRMEAYKDDPEGLEQLKQSNLQSFGNENGGTPDYFFNKYGSWETVIEKSFSTNAGADAVLGLYDKYYSTYIIDPEDDQEPTGAAETASPTEGPTEAAASSDQTEATAAPATEAPTAPAADSSVKSPKTGDPLMIVTVLILTAAGVAVISIAALRKEKQQ